MTAAPTGKIILIIDDDISLLKLLELQLKTKGYLAITAADGWTALQKLETIRPDLVILDIHMPQISGLDVYRRLCTAYGRTKYPVLVLTSREELQETFADIEADGFMKKPFLMEELLAEVERALQASTVVCLIDASPDERISGIAEALQAERYEVVRAHDLHASSHLPGHVRPQFALIEYGQLAREGRDRPNLKAHSFLGGAGVIVYSFHPDTGYDQKSLDAGADLYLENPPDAGAFVSAVRQLELKGKTKKPAH